MENLTERELEVLKLLVTGKSNREIGDEIFVTSHTIKAHLDSIYNKLKVHNRVQAVVEYIKKYNPDIE